jgi:ATPase components of various ABC-type transport systems, contain duplicated ATPase
VAGTHRLRALVDISVDLWSGETLGLVGESGSGKTTFANCCWVSMRPTPTA